MKLYHYSIELLPELKSLIAQKIPKAGRSQAGLKESKPTSTLNKIKGNGLYLADRLGLLDDFRYERNVSLFLEPLPLDVASIYNHQHEFYKKGLELYQYEVPIFNIPEEIIFRLTESPEKTDLLYFKQDWDGLERNDPKILKYKKEILEMETKLGLVGSGRNNLIKVVKKYNKGIRGYMKKAIELAKQFDEEEGVYSRYAQNVPHLMLYPGYKSIHYSEVKQIKLR